MPPAPASSFVRKCALQSTSMPALHRRNVPNCRPMVDGGMRKCSAGACPPLGSGWGVAESAAPIRCTKPQLRLFIPWCAGASRHERLVRKHVPDSDPGCSLQSTSMPALHTAKQRRLIVDRWSMDPAETATPAFHPWCAGTSRHERLVRNDRRNAPTCRKCSAVEDFARRGACPPQGSGWGVAESTMPIRCTKPQLRLFIPWCAGTSRHERLVRK